MLFSRLCSRIGHNNTVLFYNRVLCRKIYGDLLTGKGLKKPPERLRRLWADIFISYPHQSVVLESGQSLNGHKAQDKCRDGHHGGADPP